MLSLRLKVEAARLSRKFGSKVSESQAVKSGFAIINRTVVRFAHFLRPNRTYMEEMKAMSVKS